MVDTSQMQLPTFQLPARPVSVPPAPYAANALLANPAGGLPQRPPASQDPAMVADQERPAVAPGPNVVQAAGAGVLRSGSVAAGMPTPAPVVQAAPAVPAPVARAPVAAPQAPANNGIDVIAGGHATHLVNNNTSFMAPGGGGALTPRDAQLLLAAAPSRPSPQDLAGYQLYGSSAAKMQGAALAAEKNYQALVAAAGNDPAKLNDALKIKQAHLANAQQEFHQSLQPLMFPQLGLLQGERNLQGQGLPEGQ